MSRSETESDSRLGSGSASESDCRWGLASGLELEWDDGLGWESASGSGSGGVWAALSRSALDLVWPRDQGMMSLWVRDSLGSTPVGVGLRPSSRLSPALAARLAVVRWSCLQMARDP